MDELLKLISSVNKYNKYTPEEVGESFLYLKKAIDEFNNLPDIEKHEIIKDFFINNSKDCIDFAKRHPTCKYNKYIKC